MKESEILTNIIQVLIEETGTRHMNELKWLFSRLESAERVEKYKGESENV